MAHENRTKPDAKKVPISMRFDAALLDAIDRRIDDVNASGITINRTEWFENATRWIIHTLPFNASGPQRRSAALTAPPDVAGLHAEDMGIDTPDGVPPRRTP